MNSEEMLLLLDSLDLDEEIVNQQLIEILDRTSFSEKHLKNAIRFLKYKLAVNKQEGIGCNNDREYGFVAKLLHDITDENIDMVCEIALLVLQLDPKTVVSKSEHLLQQLLSEIELPSRQISSSLGDDQQLDQTNTMLYLKLCGSILEAVEFCKHTVSLQFLEIPLEKVIFSTNDKILNIFFINTIPHFMNAVTGYNILDRLWNCLKVTNEHFDITLKALSCLADYYLPIVDTNVKIKYESNVVKYIEFWEVVLLGLQSGNVEFRKMATYLINRALDYLSGSDINININTEKIVMVWDKKNETYIREMWNSFFVLMDSLEEMQYNIVLPALKLFEEIKHLGHCWISCAYSVGLKHDNTMVRLNCIRYRLEIKVDNKNEAITLLNALNDFNFYENGLDSVALKKNIAKALQDTESFVNIIQAIPLIKWSPVPLYHMTSVLTEISHIPLLTILGHANVCQIINDILKIPCNSIIIKKGFYNNMALFIINSCKGFTWQDFTRVYPQLQTEIDLSANMTFTMHLMKSLYLTDVGKKELVEIMTNSVENIDIGLLYVSVHEEEGVEFFKDIIKEKLSKIGDSLQVFISQTLNLADINFMTNLFNKTFGKPEKYLVSIHSSLAKEYISVLRYLVCLLCCSVTLEVDDIIALFQGLHCFKTSDSAIMDLLVQLNTASCLVIKDSQTKVDKKAYAMSIISYLYKNQVMIQHYQHLMFSLSEFLEVFKNICKDINTQGSGKLRNLFYEKSCEIVCFLLDSTTSEVRKVLEYVENVLDCGGHGCLKYVIRIIVKILPMALEDEDLKFDVPSFLNQICKEIAELKYNKEYIVCVEEFAKLITQDALLRRPLYNRVVIEHYDNILQMAMTRKTPLFFLVKQMTIKDVLVYENTVKFLSSLLLFVIVPKKDQRITENLSVELLSGMQDVNRQDFAIFNQHIQFLSVAVLYKVSDEKKLDEISQHIMTAIDTLLLSKYRYHANSRTHRTICRALQHLLFILLKSRQVDVKKTALWCMSLLKRMASHERSVKICLEWYVALYIYVKDICINHELGHFLRANGVPLQSQFNILFLVMRHKINNDTYYAQETEFVLDFLLSHTMGSIFNVRFITQYMAVQLFNDNDTKKKLNLENYSNIMAVINKTLLELKEDKQTNKTFTYIINDYFFHAFDIVTDLTPVFIYHGLQRYCREGCNENVDSHFAIRILEDIDKGVAGDVNDMFIGEWRSTRKWHAIRHYQGSEVYEPLGYDGSLLVQKKYCPMRNMSDVDAMKLRKTKNDSELIIVASLLEKAPNLGGLARTCEVLGIQTLVIDNMKCLEDKQFQSLSVSAERWLRVAAVRAGAPLRDFLARKRLDGYTLVGAEQTSNSCLIHDFKFPRKTLILLGHEKQGIPCNLLPHLDRCVEIPQTGVIRSLNVHVTASIFIWEYTKQNIYNVPR